MFRRWTILVVATAVFAAWSSSHGAVIVTTLGEQIVCEIVEESPTYFVVDHNGYRRYVLKSQIRLIDRGSDEMLGRGRKHRMYVAAWGSYYLTGNDIESGPNSGRLTLGYPLGNLVVLEAGFHVGKSSVKPAAGVAKMYPGDIEWAGATLGVLWEVQKWPIRPHLEISLGYFRLDHTVAAAEIARWRLFFETYGGLEPDAYFNVTEKMDPGIGIVMGAGAAYPFWGRFGISFRTSLIVLNTGFDRTYDFGDGGSPSNSGLLLHMMQANLGFQIYL